MTHWRKILLGFAGAVVLFLLVIGPWPTYRDSKYQESSYYREALAAIDAAAATNTLTAMPGALQAGWAKRNITPPVGAPLGGYSARKDGMRSTGVRDDLYVRAMALHDGQDTLVLIGSDMLIIPPNLSSMVREQVGAQVGLSPNQLLFNASHTHCGPGGFMPGLASRISGGKYEPEMMAGIATAFTEAIVDAYKGLEPAALASGGIDAPEYIRNRMREDAPVDPELSYLVVRQTDGDTCYVASYSAHPTNFGARMMEFSAEYPGELMRRIEQETSQNAQYLGGAVGSMGPRAPEGPDASSRVVAMGQALADLILAQDDALDYAEHVDIACAGVPVGMPPYQLRPMEQSTRWRLSPIAGQILGLRREGWIHGARVGDVFFVGMPFDFCGETSVEWKAWARESGLDLWTLSFCSTYCGYFSPDKYYLEAPLNYETGAMSWFGPNVEAYFTELFHTLVSALSQPAAGQ